MALLGFLGSGHCVGMCGPLATFFGLAQRHRGRSGGALIAPFARYHVGRIASYGILGLLFGLAGSIPGLVTQQGQAIVSLGAGLFTGLLAFGWMGVGPVLFHPERVPFLRRPADRLRTLVLRGGPGSELGLGLANGFLPCGPVALVVLASVASAAPWRGAVSLLTFGLGTIPALVLVGVGVGSLPVRIREGFRRVSAVLVLVLALQLVARGAAALGWISHLEIRGWVLW